MNQTMHEAEARAGLDPLDTLLADRRALVERVAKRRALYGPGGLWDALRKAELSKLQAMLRGQYGEEGKKVSEARLEEESHAHPKYQEFLTQALIEKAEHIVLEERIDAITTTIMRQQALLHYLRAEVQLGG